MADEDVPVVLCGHQLRHFLIDYGVDGGLEVTLTCQRDEGHEGRHAAVGSRDHLTWTDG